MDNFEIKDKNIPWNEFIREYGCCNIKSLTLNFD